jgi:hypothetical protein
MGLINYVGNQNKHHVAFDGTPNGIKETSENVSETDSVEEAVTDEDLNEIIRELEAEAGAGGDDAPSPGADAGALPPPEGGEDELESPMEDSQEIKAGDTVTITGTVTKAPPAGGEEESPVEQPSVGGEEGPVSEPAGEEPAPMEEEEIDLNELLASLNEEAGCHEEEKKEEEEEEKVDEVVAKLDEAISQRDEAYRTVEYLRKQINEVNLLNAKLLYTNKLFKEFGMNRDQKTKVVEAFDLTKNVREVKMTYANWCESLNFGGNVKKKTVTQSPVYQTTTITEGSASKTVASTKPSKQVITEGVDETVRRFQKLAGIPSKK